MIEVKHHFKVSSFLAMYIFFCVAVESDSPILKCQKWGGGGKQLAKVLLLCRQEIEPQNYGIQQHGMRPLQGGTLPPYSHARVGPTHFAGPKH